MPEPVEGIAADIAEIKSAVQSIERMFRDFLDMVIDEMRAQDAMDSSPLESGEPK